jgi:hypothetical protein
VNPTSITQEAQCVSLLFQYGVITSEDVIAWADRMIVEIGTPSESLLDLSTTSPCKTEDIISCLHRLSVGADLWAAFRNVIPKILEFILSHPEKAEGVAYHLFLTACYYTAPKDLRFLYRIEDDFSLANEGVLGNRETVYQNFVDELKKFTSST